MSNFRFQNKRALLTYKTHVNKEDIVQFIDSLSKLTRAAVCHETGSNENEKYEHTHIIIEFEKAFQTRNARKFDYNNIHPHIKKLPNNKAMMDAFHYISKEDPNIYIYGKFEEETTFTKIVERIWDCETEQDVLKQAKSSSDVLPFLKIWQYKMKADRHIKYQEKIINMKLNKHQINWHNILLAQNDREILWVYDHNGGTGKTTFGKWLFAQYPTFIMTMSNKDNGFRYQGEEYVVCNLTRQMQESMHYGALEFLKDGLISTGKYEGKQALYEPPKMIVFANFYPETHYMTEDRWTIYDTEIDGHD